MTVHGTIQLQAAGRRLPSRASTAFTTVYQNRPVRRAAPQSNAGVTAVSCQESTAQLRGTSASISDIPDKPIWPPAWAEAPAVSALPISRDVQRILQALHDGSNLVLEAPPGAGKTTLVPLALLEGAISWLQPNATILVVEPRRLAARAAAHRMADLLGEPVGERVGYRVRLDSCTGPRTRIEVVTTGMLLQRLQADPQLRGVGAVMLDEFHERGWQSDLIFALCLACQRQARADLRMVIMSATISAQLQERLTQQLRGPAMPLAMGVSMSKEQQGELSSAEITIISCKGRSYPVKTVYLGSFAEQDLCKAAEAAILRALKEQNGGILCFLPGRGEVAALQRALSASASTQLAVLPLYGDLSREEQDRVMRSPDDGARRVVLATPIAESSLTVPGVSVVVDCGFVRKPWYDAATGLERLRQARISQASAAQRQGRAGRTQPGACYRLYSKALHASLAPDTQPEILSTDPWPLALQLAAWQTHRNTSRNRDRSLPPPTSAAVNNSRSAHNPPNGLRQGGQLTGTTSSIRPCDRDGARPEAVVGELPWLDKPPDGLLQAASHGLTAIGALDDAGRLTETGWRMSALGMHPRLARMLLLSENLGMPALGATLAAMLEERDFVRDSGADIWLRLKALASSLGVQSAAVERIRQLVKQSLASLQSTAPKTSKEYNQVGSSAGSSPKNKSIDPRLAVGLLVASAYPDRIAQRKERGNRSRAAFLLANGETARLPNELDPLNDCEYLAVASLGGNNLKGDRNFNIFLAAPLVITAVEEHLPHLTSTETTSYWAPTSKSVMGRMRTRIGQVVIVEELDSSLADEDALSILRAQLRSARKLPLTPEALHWQQRLQWLREFSLSALACDKHGGLTADGQTDGKGQQDGPLAARSIQEALLAAIDDYGDATIPVVESPQAHSASLQPGCSPLRGTRQGRQLLPTDSARRQKKARGGRKGGQQERSLAQQVSVQGSGGGGSSSAEQAAFRESVGAEAAAELLRLPDASNEALLASADGWLEQHLIGLRTWREVEALPWEQLLRARCSAEQLAAIDSLAPPSVQLTPTQVPLAIDYTRSRPRLLLPLHDVIGIEALRCSAANGTFPVTLELLSPKGEALACCVDLAEFWKNQYANLRKRLRSKYPKVDWP